jgi:uncharacterized lipoprotein YddW (UPF0748 family)
MTMTTRARQIAGGRRAFVGGVGATLLAAAPALARAAFKTEIIVRTVNNLRGPRDVSSLVALAARHGVATINLAAKQDEDDEIRSGLVFYASRIAPRAPGFEAFDALGDTVREAHRQGLRVRAWMPQFHDQMAAQAHPGWQMQSLRDGRVLPFSGAGRKEVFVNPLNLEARDYQRSLIEEVARSYDVDGIVIDWVRFDDYAMDLGEETRARFKASSGVDPIAIDFATDNPQRRQWNAWREAGIADHVRQLRAALDAIRPGIELGVYILPPEFVEVAQDAAQFAGSVTFLSPMAYHKDWGLPATWIVDTLLPQTIEKAGGTKVIPVFDEDLTDDAGRKILSHIGKAWPVIDTLAWFSYGRWTSAALQRIDRLLQ